jgi:Protein of unknown function (DUF1501)
MRLPITRREMLGRCANGFGLFALNAILGTANGVAPHFRPRATNVILLFMDGGVSHVDSFDPKPRLQAEHGQPFRQKIEATQFDDVGKILGSPWQFRPRGQSGIEVSELFPNIAACSDELCVIRSMRADFPEHAQACLYMHTGHSIQGRPSMGAWLSYGLGTDCKELPGFVVVHGGIFPTGGVENFSSGFLPAQHQGSVFEAYSSGGLVRNLAPGDPVLQRAKLGFVAEADRDFAADVRNSTVEAAIRNYETAFAMQSAVPELAALENESEATRKLYGLDSPNKQTALYARECLLARRLIERGVRFVEVTCPRGSRNNAPWDQHDNLRKQHAENAQIVDQPIAALLQDLRGRGLLDETLVIWAGEFGRTPFAQGGNGRDHNPQGFSIWLAGGGVRAGSIHGSTDDYGYHAIENVMTVHDLHATILHLLGLDHERLIYRHAGRDFRLTDVYGTVIKDILA